MKEPSMIKPQSQLSPTQCPRCGNEMRLVERCSMSGSDMRSYCCDNCQQEHIVDFGTALWKILSDARGHDR